MKIKDKKYLSIILMFILLISIVIIYLYNNTEILNKILGKETRQAVTEQNIEYKIYKYANNEGKMLIKFQDSENGIERIEYPNNENTLTCNGKNVVAVEYPIVKDSNYEFKMYTTKGEEVISNITINDEFLYANGINYEEKKVGSGYKIINLTYMQDIDDSFKHYYKVGENGEWEEYEGPLWLFDYDIVKENLINTEDNTVTLYAKSVNSVNEEVILSQKYNIDINATESSITADSLLQIASEDYFTAGTYKVKVKDETYSLHVYEFNESQIWNDDVSFGSKKDVATSTSDMAKNMVVVKVNGDLTINEGVTVTAYADENGYGGPKGMMLYVTGTLTNNGTISMTARGAYAEGQNVYLYKNADDTYEYVPAEGATGGAGITLGDGGDIGKKANGNKGKDGSNRQTAGGGSGSCYIYSMEYRWYKWCWK